MSLPNITWMSSRDTQRPPRCPVGRLVPPKGLGVPGSLADPVAGGAVAFAAFGGGGGGIFMRGGLCAAPPPPSQLTTFFFATAPWLPLRWQSTNVPPPGMPPPRGVVHPLVPPLGTQFKGNMG